MSKTIDLQIEKCRTLIHGLSNNIDELSNKGINSGTLDAMTRNLDRLADANRECDELRATLSAKVKAMNAILAEVKDAYADNKRMIKTNYPQDKWLKYGVVDKR